MKTLCRLAILPALIVCQFYGYLTHSQPTAAKPNKQAEGPSVISLPLIRHSGSPVIQRNTIENIIGTEVSLFDDIYSSAIGATQTRWMRSNALAFLWNEIEAEEGVRNWGVPSVRQIEQQLLQAAKQNYKVIKIVRGTPEWARRDPGQGATCGPIHPDKLPAFAKFIKELVARYSAPPYNIKYWEIGNEPDAPAHDGNEVFGCWGNPADKYGGGRDYAQMLKVVYPAVKAGSPNAIVVMGGLVLDCSPTFTNLDCAPSRFLEGILEGGGGGSFDIANIHAYDYWGGSNEYSNRNWASFSYSTGPSLIAKTNYVRDILSQYGLGNKPIINTEFALLCWQCENSPPGFEQAKAIYLAQANVAALSKGLMANIWYSVPGWINYQTQLIELDGRPNLAYRALKFSAEQLSGVSYVGEETSNRFVRAYILNRKGAQTWVVWALGVEQNAINLPSMPSAVFDMYGTPLQTARSLRVTEKPIYIHFAPGQGAIQP